MGSRRDSFITRDPIRSVVEPKGPSLGDVLTKRPEPGRGKPAGKLTLKPLPPKGKKP